MKNKKGFTLIELLTVIAILAIILLIAAPTILGVLEKAKKNTFKNQVLLYVESMKTQMALRAMNDSDLAADALTYDETEKKYSIDVTKVPMDSQTLKGGTIKITDNGNGVYTFELVAVHDDNYTVTATDAKDIKDAQITKYTATTPESGS